MSEGHPKSQKERPRPAQAKEHDVKSAIHRLDAQPQKYGEVYNACSHAYVMVRELAAKELADFVGDGSAEALDRLIVQMQDIENRFIRETAARSLGRIAVDDDKVCSRIMDLLPHESSRIREAGLISLRIRLHSPRVLQALKDSQEGKVKQFEREKRLLPTIQDLCADPNGRVRFMAVDALEIMLRNFHRESIDAVISCLGDPEEWVRRFAAEILCETLAAGRDVLAQTSAIAQTYMKEGYNELFKAGVKCYDFGQTLEGGGDTYLRKLATQGLAAAAVTKEEVQAESSLSSFDELDQPLDLDQGSVVVSYGPDDAIEVLRRALKDEDLDVRQVASTTLLSLSAEGNLKAIDAVMWDVDTCITDGIGIPGLGSHGTPEVEEYKATNPEWLALQAEKAKAPKLTPEEEHDLWVKEQERIHQLRLIQVDIQQMKEIAEAGVVSELRIVAFPPKAEREEVLEAEQEMPERIDIRIAAAEGLMMLSQKHASKEAGKAISDHLEEFAELTGFSGLLNHAEEKIKVQQVQEETQTRVKTPETEVCEKLRTLMLEGTSSAIRGKAATELARLVEEGDSAAVEVVVENGSEFTQCLKLANYFSAKILSNSEVLARLQDWK